VPAPPSLLQPSCRYAAAAKQLPSTVDGKALSRMPEYRFKQLCNDDEKRGHALYEHFR
jgi:hypothetical protein